MSSEEKLKFDSSFAGVESPTTSSSDDDPEKHIEKPLNVSEQLKLDSNGLPLVPQPSRFKDDPLVQSQFPKPDSLVQDHL
jgi:hypothetical protein